MNANTRNIPVTTLFSENEFSDFKKACANADVKHSTQLRSLAHVWMRQQTNDRRLRRRPEYTGHTHNMPISVPAWGGKGNFHVRL